MLKAYLSVIHVSLILADMCRYHTQLSMVASDIDMISVIFIRGKSLKLHAPVSIHTMGISLAHSNQQYSHSASVTTLFSLQSIH